MTVVASGRPPLPDMVAVGAYRYATTHALTELEDVFGRRWLRKDLGRDAVLPAAAGVAPEPVVDAHRELEVYRRLLPSVGTLAPTLAAISDDCADRSWIVIEKIDGPVLWQIGEVETWCEVAAALARLHRLLAPRTGTASGSLLRVDEDLQRAWAQCVRVASRMSAAEGSRLFRVAQAGQEAADAFAQLPGGIIHGEAYPSNVMVAGGSPPRVVFIDWEMAAVGPYAVDLAALVTGWGDVERDAMIGSYAEVAGRPVAELADEVDLATLHLCLRWLGWSQNWTPPQGHRHDWLSLAEDVIARLDL